MATLRGAAGTVFRGKRRETTKQRSIVLPFFQLGRIDVYINLGTGCKYAYSYNLANSRENWAPQKNRLRAAAAGTEVTMVKYFLCHAH